VLQKLAAIARHLATIQRIDPTLTRLQESYDNGYYAIEALARELEEYQASVDLDPSRLEDVRRRRDLLFRLTKKYGGSLDGVIRTGEDARRELDLVDSAGLDIRQLESREREARAALEEHAAVLSELRRAGAERLARAVDEVLPDLGMPDGHVTVALRALREIGACGAEDVEFCVALNVGHEPRPLSRVASGGELSRVMLALKTILARVDRVPTLIFDEVDAGIGGRVGLQVGDTLRRVASEHQVFAISHLPQIAARAHHHIVVAKGAKGGVTTADISVLEGTSRVHEIARMLGGDPESKVSRAHAKELLESAVAPG
jgi:DNA repair protein RecN (Recombination protein N)